MAEFVQVASVSDVSDPGKMLVEVDDRLVALFHVGGQWFAIDDVCTHDGGPLAEGKLEDHTIACPRHGAKFDIRTGAALTMPATKPTASHEVKVEAGQVFVRLRDGEAQNSDFRSQSSEDGNGRAGSSPVGGSKAQSSAPPPLTPALSPEGRGSFEAAARGAGGPGASSPADVPPDAVAVSEDRIREELKQVVDPELFVNVIDLGLVYSIDLKPAVEEPAATQPRDTSSGMLVPKTDVQIEMTLTSPACPAGPQLIQQTHQALGRLPGIGQVNVRLVMDPPWTPDRMTEAARDQLGIF
jgi:metal-sulfur cluster biosynthetic enzyme/nitrite reductase/ring-hydroxylating ferredoxin subunit